MSILKKEGLVYSYRADLSVSLKSLVRAANQIAGVEYEQIIADLDAEKISPQTTLDRLPLSIIQGVEKLINDQADVAHISASPLAARIKAVRCYMGWTKVDVSRLPGMDVTHETVRLWEMGRIAANVRSLEIFAKAASLPILYLRTGLLFGIPPDRVLGRKLGEGATISATSLKVWQAINGCASGSRDEIFAAISQNAEASRLSRECGGYYNGHNFCLWHVPVIEAQAVRPDYNPVVASKNLKLEAGFTILMRDITNEVIAGNLTMAEGRIKLNAYRAERGEKPATFAALSNSVARTKARAERAAEEKKAKEEKAKQVALDPYTNAIWTFNNLHR